MFKNVLTILTLNVSSEKKRPELRDINSDNSDFFSQFISQFRFYNS